MANTIRASTHRHANSPSWQRARSLNCWCCIISSFLDRRKKLTWRKRYAAHTRATWSAAAISVSIRRTCFAVGLGGGQSYNPRGSLWHLLCMGKVMLTVAVLLLCGSSVVCAQDRFTAGLLL